MNNDIEIKKIKIEIFDFSLILDNDQCALLNKGLMILMKEHRNENLFITKDQEELFSNIISRLSKRNLIKNE